MNKYFGTLGFKPGDVVRCTESNVKSYEVGKEYTLIEYEGKPITERGCNGYSGSWEKVEVHKFKVGDKIRMKTQEGTLYTYYDFPESVTIASICEDNYRYVAEDSSGIYQTVHEDDIELASEITYEDQWHLNDGVTPIPEGADTLEKDGSVVAYRKVKTPDVETKTLTLEFDPYNNTFEDVRGCVEESLGTVEFTLTFTDGKITDIKTKILE